MKIAKIIAVLGVFAMTAALFYGFTQGNFSVDGGEILANPWGIVSLVDLYVGFTLFSLWIAFRETNILIAIVWIFFMMTLGFFTGAVYVLVALLTCKNDWATLFFGKRRNLVLGKK
ncbi:MAG: DUF1475 domain-containing protein [Bacillus subtilis]|nr:DUF1475 domain-containing protein [Bacillus subtilis]